jgi:hypothetical protein
MIYPKQILNLKDIMWSFMIEKTEADKRLNNISYKNEIMRDLLRC